MGNFGPIVVQNYASQYLRMCSKDFFQFLQHDKARLVDKNRLSETSKKCLLDQMGNFDPIAAQKLCKLIYGICSKVLFQTFQHDRAQQVEKNYSK